MNSYAIITTVFRSSYEVLMFSSECNQITFQWSVVVAASSTNFSESPSSGGRFVQCKSTDRRTDKINLSFFLVVLRRCL